MPHTSVLESPWYRICRSPPSITAFQANSREDDNAQATSTHWSLADYAASPISAMLMMSAGDITDERDMTSWMRARATDSRLDDGDSHARQRR